MYDMIIVGAGTAGLSAAIYGARAGKNVLVLEANTYGGQIVRSPEVENYPGIAHISGYEFAQNLYDQAVNLGAAVEFENVVEIRADGQEKYVVTEDNEYTARAVILATGAVNRPLGVDGEDDFVGAGISYCATCDGAFFKGKDVAVVGGGSTALEDALFLSAYCRKVYLIHRRDAFRGEQKYVDNLKTKDNIEFVLNSQVTALKGNDFLEAVDVKNKVSGETVTLPVSGLFVAIGQMPQNGPFAGLINLDDGGYIAAGEDCRTNVEGIFTAGDCRTKTVRQLTTAASDGAAAALAACEYLG
ncbi:MAG: thioredoxin-disulfide reductase [Catenibacillus sp.]|nr:thioredoxin-disulfide reductase [Catenibacillus sp.]